MLQSTCGTSCFKQPRAGAQTDPKLPTSWPSNQLLAYQSSYQCYSGSVKASQPGLCLLSSGCAFGINPSAAQTPQGAPFPLHFRGCSFSLAAVCFAKIALHRWGLKFDSWASTLWGDCETRTTTTVQTTTFPVCNPKLLCHLRDLNQPNAVHQLRLGSLMADPTQRNVDNRGTIMQERALRSCKLALIAKFR